MLIEIVRVPAEEAGPLSLVRITRLSSWPVAGEELNHQPHGIPTVTRHLLHPGMQAMAEVSGPVVQADMARKPLIAVTQVMQLAKSKMKTKL